MKKAAPSTLRFTKETPQARKTRVASTVKLRPAVYLDKKKQSRKTRAKTYHDDTLY